MNPNTGKVFRGIEIEAARGRGEPLVMVSDEVAAQQEVGKTYLEGFEDGKREFMTKWFAMTPKERAREMQAIRKAGRSHSGKKRIRKVGIR